MKVIGLTGGIGAGKSTVSSYLREKGCRIIDADRMARKLTEAGSPALTAISRTFGDDLIFPDGSLDRKKLASIVFSDPAKLRKLESLTTEKVVSQIAETIASLREHGERGIVFVDAPLLFETGADRLTDLVFMVSADTEVRIRRVTERDGITRQQVLERIASQMDEGEKAAKSAEIIDNSKGKEELYRQIDALLEKYAETE